MKFIRFKPYLDNDAEIIIDVDSVGAIEFTEHKCDNSRAYPQAYYITISSKKGKYIYQYENKKEAQERYEDFKVELYFREGELKLNKK